MKYFGQYRLTWIKRKLRYPTGEGMRRAEFEIIVEVIKYYVPTTISFGYRLLRNVRKAVIQMRSMRAEYM